MKLETFQYRFGQGWSVQEFPNLDSENTLIIVFSAPEFIDNPAPIKELVSYYPKSKIIGCSSAGEISGPRILDNSISVAVVKFEKTPIAIIKREIASSDDSFRVGATLAEQLNDNHLRAIFILSDGLKVNGSDLVKGLNTIKNTNVIITGGLAADGRRFKETWSLFEGEIVKNNVIGVGFYGKNIQIGYGSRGGWDIFGAERRITHSENNILYELDGMPALAFYKDYLGLNTQGLPASGLLYPLAIHKDEPDSRQLIRTILTADEKTQSLTFAGEMPKNYLAQFMRASFDKLITAADEAGELATKRMIGIENNKPTPVLAIAISCVGRRLLLGEKTSKETESTLDSLPFGTKQIGFYSYGELSPYSGAGNCDLHNQSMTLTTLCEDES